jgi:thermitase
VLSSIVAVLGAGAAGCLPAGSAPAPASCDAASAPTPTGQHPVNYVAVVRPQPWSRPEATSFTATSVGDKNAKVTELASTGTVLAVEPNHVLHAQLDPPVGPTALSGSQYGLGVSPPGGDFQRAWNLPRVGAGYSGVGATIAIVDTGVELDHQGLAGRVTAGPDFIAGATPENPTPLVSGDPNGHGTHVAGIAADDDPLGGLGGAPNAHLLAVRVLDASGSGSDVDVYNGIVWATSAGATVINLSLGGPGCDSVLQNAVAYAHDHGVVVVAAAGNDGNTELFSPAAYSSEVIAVAATDPSGHLASFSNHGGFVAVAAPGVSVLSTCAWSNGCVGGTVPSTTAYGYLSGTSMATPFVSAAAALLKEECGASFPPDRVKHELTTRSSGLVPFTGIPGLDAYYAIGAGCG